MTGERFLSGRARIAGLMGWPVGHSLSPRLHGFWLRHYAIDGAYVPLPVAPENLAQALRALPALGFRGCNLTIPHKEAALGLVDEATPQALRVGAVNTVTVDQDGRLHGDNTDGSGFVASLREACPTWQAATGPAVLLGSGGAARAIATALLAAGAPELRLVNRTRARAQELGGALGDKTRVLDWGDWSRALAGTALLVNTSSLGMQGQPPLDVALDFLPPHALVTDVVYAPLETGLLAAARARGNPVVDGLGMLLHQARPGFRAWFGVEPEVTPELRAAVLAGLG
jgi:shikimate dehydrogenase